MPFTPYPGVAEAVIHGERDGNERVTVLHYVTNDPPWDLAKIQNLAYRVHQEVGNGLAGVACIGTSILYTETRDLSTEDGVGGNYAVTAAGSGGADVMPANIAALILKKTGSRGRSAQGRVYAYDVSEDLFNGSTINPLGRANLDTLATRIAATLDTEFIPVVLSKKTGNVYPILGTQVQNVAATMRKRLPGRGS